MAVQGLVDGGAAGLRWMLNVRRGVSMRCACSGENVGQASQAFPSKDADAAQNRYNRLFEKYFPALLGASSTAEL